MSEDSTDDISDMEMVPTPGGPGSAKVFHLSDSSEEEGKSARSEQSYPSEPSEISDMDLGDTLSAGAEHPASVCSSSPSASARYYICIPSE